MRIPVLALSLSLLAGAAVVSRPATADAQLVQPQPIQWTIASGGNDHWYQLFDTMGDWNNANAVATGMVWNGQTGYLASLTSSSEDAFVQSLLPNGCNNYSLPCIGYWIGAYQDHSAPDYAEPSGGWRWSSGETFAYSNWGPGEPNNSTRNCCGGDDDFALIYNTDPIWNDAGGKWNDDYRLGRFVAEFNPTTVPEPSTYALMATGLFGLGVAAHRRRKSPNAIVAVPA